MEYVLFMKVDLKMLKMLCVCVSMYVYVCVCVCVKNLLTTNNLTYINKYSTMGNHMNKNER